MSADRASHTGPPHRPYQATIARVRDALVEVYDELDAWTRRPAEFLAFRPGPGQWTAAEILEHVALTNFYVAQSIGKLWPEVVKASRAEHPDLYGESDLDRLEPIGSRGAFDWPHPERVAPSGRIPVDQVRLALREERRAALNLLSLAPDGKGALATRRSIAPGAGELDLYQWLYFIAMHGRRHLQQLRENDRLYRERAGS